MSQDNEKAAFVLVALGTAGLLANEYAFSWGRIATLVFGALSLVGLIALGILRWGAGRRKRGREL